jgi:molybdopterin synthase catalytic subunit
MQTVGIVGPDRRTLAARLVDRVSGSAAVVDAAETDAATPTDQIGAADTTYRRTPDGWRGRGESLTLAGVLDRLAVRHDYAIVLDAPDARIPQVVLGDASVRGDVVATAPNADAIDVDQVVAAVEDRDPRVTLEALVARVKDSADADKAGAIATFTGRVRVKDHEDDSPTEYLEFERYEGVADDRLATIRSELEARDGVYAVRFHHRTGVVRAGEDIVFVVVLAGHREEAFRTVEDGIDRLKDEVPIFKKEVTVEDEFWVHERA